MCCVCSGYRCRNCSLARLLIPRPQVFRPLSHLIPIFCLEARAHDGQQAHSLVNSRSGCPLACHVSAAFGNFGSPSEALKHGNAGTEVQERSLTLSMSSGAIVSLTDTRHCINADSKLQTAILSHGDHSMMFTAKRTERVYTGRPSGNVTASDSNSHWRADVAILHDTRGHLGHLGAHGQNRPQF